MPTWKFTRLNCRKQLVAGTGLLNIVFIRNNRKHQLKVAAP